MRGKLGVLSMIAGLLLITAAFGLFLYNQSQEQRAETAVQAAMPALVEQIRDEHARQQEQAAAAPEQGGSQPDQTQIQVPVLPSQRTMKEVQIDGYAYIGFVSIPALQLELPVMSDWSYEQLELAPCRFAGESYSDDLVIMAHNYLQLFGKLTDLRAGDTVIFTDMEAQVTEYRVVALDLLHPDAVEEMNAGVYDLTLFTCTYGGGSRITVRCDRVK